ncbi:hypothetical protein [Actinoplanes sp. DH11]|uniref:hypothetical protein n=1 Tax=Actinoplanes sp. DH11 TaxID=2857011 RepID=UPI001E47EE16|nr:hypothetical protein [Actinoplanes sp. DH11]
MTVDDVTYYARMRAGERATRPSWVLRRVASADRSVDELLGRDGEWHPTDMLARAERGELPGTLRQTSRHMPEAHADSARVRYGVARRAIAKQRSGEFLLRLAVPGTGTGFGPLDAEAQAEVVAFLTGAPLVSTGPAGTFRTDGMWVWPESIAGEVLASGAHPEDELYHHILERRFCYPETVEPAVLDRARQLLESAAAGDGTRRVQETNVPGRPAPPTMEERQQALGAWHGEWQRRHAGSTPFRPELHAADPDYNLHHVDLEASSEADHEFLVRAREIMGLDPETGAAIDF